MAFPDHDPYQKTDWDHLRPIFNHEPFKYDQRTFVILYVGGVNHGKKEALREPPKGVSIRVPIVRARDIHYFEFDEPLPELDIEYDEYLLVEKFSNAKEALYVYATKNQAQELNQKIEVQRERIAFLERENEELTELLYKDATE